MSYLSLKSSQRVAADELRSQGRSRAAKMFGIGCVTLALLGGFVLAFGVWKTASCVGSISDSAVKQGLVWKFVFEISDQLQKSEFEPTRAQMSSALAEQLSAGKLRVKRREYAQFFENSMPHISEIRNTGGDIWRASVEFSPPPRRQKLVIVMDVNTVDGEYGDISTLVLESLVFEQRDRDLRAEPAAAAVIKFHRELRNQNTKKAFVFVAPVFGEISKFHVFLARQKPVFRQGTLKVESVENLRSSARVIVQIGEEGSDPVRVEYEVGVSKQSVDLYEIRDITPLNASGQAGAP